MKKKIKVCVVLVAFILLFMEINFDVVYAEGETTTTTAPTTTVPTTTTGTASPQDSQTTTTTTTTPGTSQTVDEILPSMIDPLDNPEGYKPSIKNSEQPTAKGYVSKILKIIRNFGVIISVGILTIIGVKYMISGGAEEKAQYKESLIPIGVGAVMLLGSVALVSAIAKVMS